jgi:hypothetical protein
MHIEFLFWEDCPSHTEALRRLKAVMESEGITEPIDIQEVLTDAEAEHLGFPGSPTIRINGHDIDPPGADAAGGFSLSCRVYRTPSGRVTPLPPVAMIRDAFHATAHAT